ncbi:MAG: ATP synthase subunit I [Lachnospiraceae bacterium]|nr:ATP synthase subunit I [Lachnospiraceae bacterium]
MKKLNATLAELWVGSVLFALASLIIGIWFAENKLAYAIGLLVGTLTTMYLAWHMARSIDKMMDKAEQGLDGSAGMRVSSLLRYGLVVLILIASAFVSEYVNPISVFLGILGLKVAAYLQPFTHKIVFKVFGWEEEVYPDMPDTEENKEV